MMPTATTVRRQHRARRAALSEIALAGRILQLYPSATPVARQAVRRAHAALAALSPDAPLVVDGLAAPPAAGAATQSGLREDHLARRLHDAGVARLRLDADLTEADLTRLLELLADEAPTGGATGSLASFARQEELSGVAVEELPGGRRDRDHTPEGHDSDLWDDLLERHGATEGRSPRWLELVGDRRRLGAFLAAVLADDPGPSATGDTSRSSVLAQLLGHLGTAAAVAGSELLGEVAETMADLGDDVADEVWLELLTSPLPADEGSGRALRQRLVEVLDRRRLLELVAHLLSAPPGSSPRLEPFLEEALERRPDTAATARAIRELVDRGTGGDAATAWPRLAAALREGRLSAADDTAAAPPPDTSPVADPELVEALRRELTPIRLLERRTAVVVALLEAEGDDAAYRALGAELERTLPDLVLEGRYGLLEEVLATFRRHADAAGGRPVGQRQVARDALLHLCNRRTVVEMIRNLAGRPAAEIDAAGHILGTLGAAAVPALLDALSEESSRPVRLHLLRVLATFGDDVLPEIRRHLRDERWYFVRNLAWIIGEVGDRSFVPHLSTAARHPDVRVRREAVRALAKLGGDGAAERLLEALADPAREVRRMAIRGLGHSGSRRGVPALCRLLRLPNRTGRHTGTILAAAIALGHIGDPHALPHLRRLARGPLLYRARRQPATEAARWAVGAIRREAGTGAPPAPPGAPALDP